MKRITTFLLFALCFCPILSAQQAETLYLSGTGLRDTKTWEFRCSAGLRSGVWSTIEVPSQWELQGYGEYNYGRGFTQKPLDEYGEYRYSFKVPASWKGRDVKIVFEGVMTDATVKINGQSAGKTHQGGFYRFTYDVSGLLKYGSKNLLEVLVKKESDNPSVNNAERRADWWNFGGIYRPVYLSCTAREHIESLSIDARHTGVMNVSVETLNAPEGSTIEYTLAKLDGSEKQSESRKLESGKQTDSLDWGAVLPWECEHPNLYNLSVSLVSPDGKTLHTLEQRVGFRTVEFRPQDGLYVNGTRLVLKGINRHSFHPEGGRCTDRAISLEDALLIKEMNMNAVRSHYPPDTHFLEMCDSLGLFYLDELAGWHGRYDTSVGSALVEEMVLRDRNHPCIVLWDNGNEGGWNTELDPLFDKYDPQGRHVIHPWADFDQLDTHHYPTFLTGVGRFTNGYKVFMPTEFMHTNSDQGGGAGLEDFWANWSTHPLFAGGFIWAFVDESVKRVDKGGILDDNFDMGDDGVVGPYREKEGSFYAIRDIWSPIQIARTFITPSFKGDFYVTNKFLFSNLKDCRIDYRLKRISTPKMGAGSRLAGAGTLKLPDLAPNCTGIMHFDLPEHFFDADILELEAFDPAGKSVTTWTFPIHYAADYFARHNPIEESGPAAMIFEKDSLCTLSAAGVAASFNTNTGELEGIWAGNKKSPFGGLRPIGIKMRFIGGHSRQDGPDALYVAKYLGAVDSIVWRMTSDGKLGLDAVLLNRDNGGVKGGFDDGFMDRDITDLGFSFDYPEENVQGLKWLGRGPYRVWKNRQRGHNIDFWTKDYNNTITAKAGQGKLVYPEFKGYHGNIYWAEFVSETAPLAIYSETDGLFLKVYNPEEPDRGGLPGADLFPKLPDGDLAVLFDIQAIKSFKAIQDQGPKSQRGNIRIKSGDEGLRLKLWFDFFATSPSSAELAKTARPVAGSSRKGGGPVLFLVGDSTMRTGTLGNGDNGQWGWGYHAHEFFDESRIGVENQALGGLSIRTYYRDYWPDVLKGIQKGDYVILELGHNDSGPYDSPFGRSSIPGTGKETCEVTLPDGRSETVLSYGEYLRRFIDEIRAKGANPLLFTLTPRNQWTEDGQLRLKSDSFDPWIAEIGKEKKVPVIDLEGITAAKYRSFSREKVDYMFFSDNIHTSDFGAVINARSAAEGILACKQTDLGKYLLPLTEPKQEFKREAGGKPALIVTGDSTIQNKDSDPDGMWGWGSVLETVFDPEKITLVNAGKAGRSARTFLNEGRWEKVYNAIQPGDFVVIQFGHNDIGFLARAPFRAELPGNGNEKKVFFMPDRRINEGIYSYGWYLRKFIDDVREKGGIPILVSLTPRNEWPDGKMERRIKDNYGDWCSEVVKQTGVDYVDMHNITADYYDSIGPEATKPYYKNDHTHTSRLGAERNAKSFAEGLRKINHPLAKYLK